MTLVEVLIAAAIGAMIIAVVGSAIFQFTRVTEKGAESFTAAHDVQNIGHWINIDGKGANTTNLVDDAAPVSSMTLTWDDGGQSHTCVYSLVDTDLKRVDNGNTTIIGRNVTNAEFSVSQRLITANVTSEPQGRWGISEQIIFKVYLRPTV